jgi:NitT/TauT family transport system permease protein
VIAELISANRGLGYLVQTGAMNFDTTSVFAAIVMATLLVLGANWLMNALETLLLRWRPPIESIMES